MSLLISAGEIDGYYICSYYMFYPSCVISFLHFSIFFLYNDL